MTAILRRTAALSALIACLAAIGLGQVPFRTKTTFDINVPYAVRLGNSFILAPGQYVLYQDSQNQDLFALYPQDMTHAPIAQIFTTRTPYWADRHRGESRIELRIDEGSPQPVLKGWTVPFADRWDVKSVKTNANNGSVTRIN